MKIGDMARAEVMAADSFYKKVEGVISNIKNGWVHIQATRVISKWSKEWEDHPTSCATSAKIENVVVVKSV